MPNSFKSDDSFLRKLAVGAAGTNAAIARLREMGFNPIELERGSTGFKIWKKIKIKRVRVPDILCLSTGLRFESRGKTKLEISMSHSLNDPKRAWDAGMRDDDFVSFVMFEQSESSPLDLRRKSPVHFVMVEDMRSAFVGEKVVVTKPKGAEEGAERRVQWKCAVANVMSCVTAVTGDRINMRALASGGKQTVRLTRGDLVLESQVSEGDTVEMNQIVAAVVPVHLNLRCPEPVDEAYFIDKLKSVSLSERYAAAKALRYRGYATADTILAQRMNDTEEDIYVQLEAAAALAAFDQEEGWKFIEDKVHSAVLRVPLETQLEAVIVASELLKKRSEDLLIAVLRDATRDSELRAGAAWALGQFASPASATALVDTFKSSPLEIRVEAARALLQIAGPQVEHLVTLLKTDEPSRRDGISWALARTGKFNPASLLAGADDNLRRWVTYMVGYGKKNFAKADIDSICRADPEVYFAASVLWQIVESWINELKEY